MTVSSTDDRRPTVRAWLVRNPDTGEVVHVHHEVDFGTPLPDGSTATQRATALAGRRGRGATVEEAAPGNVPGPPEVREPTDA